uniref:Uncharacterized protein n=1 Tax=Strigamia maritima TaxID=126957 RepID=T1IQF4_STRMM
MKLATIVSIALVQSIISIAAVPLSDDKKTFPADVEYFTLKYPDGKEITETTDELFPDIYNKYASQIEVLPRHGEILEASRQKLDESLSRLEKEGASGLAISLETANIVADMYEELFAEIGLKLKIYNRQPAFLGMKLAPIVRFAVLQLIITFAVIQLSASKANFPDNVEYFTLKYPNGTEISAPTNEFRAIYHQLKATFKLLPRYEEILRRGDKKIDNEVKRLEKEGAGRLEMSTAAVHNTPIYI